MRTASSVRWLRTLATTMVSLSCVAIGRAPADDSADDFDRTIAPLLAKRCLDCHNTTDKKGGLDLSRREAALAGGESGVVLKPGQPDQSLLWERLAADEMPPKKPLPPAEKAVLKAWIARGAKWGANPIDPFRFTSDRRAGYDWWSLQPLARTPLPAVKDADRPRSPIDHFVQAKLDALGLTAAATAERRTLIRRLSFDLLGLPPAPEEVTEFVADEAPDAYERLADRLLASPHFGERWARHWLDVAHFGESDGFEYDKLRLNAWPYRDWVVNAFNRDLPYDEFARLQIAGDVLQPNDEQALAATGFLVAGAFDGLMPAGDLMKQIMRHDGRVEERTSAN